MKRIIIKHLSGSRAGQVQEFPLDQFKQLTIGRDPASSVKYDPDGDDLVSRNHAVIAADAADPDYFTITDLGSTNGTFVNNQRLSALMRLRPGDVVTFGPGGSSFEFDLDPRPQTAPRTTRHLSAAQPGRTREASIGGAAASSPPPTSAASSSSGASGSASAATPPPASSWSGFGASSASGAPGGAARGSVSASPSGSFGGGAGGVRPPSRETVEHIVRGANREMRKQIMIGGTVAVAAIVLTLGVFFYLTRGQGRELLTSEAKTSPTPAVVASPTPVATPTALPSLTPDQIAAKYRGAVVRINGKWSLIDAASRRQVYFKCACTSGGYPVPLYARDGKELKPKLTMEAGECNIPVSGVSIGSGFVVSNDGSIMTNLHVAAPWNMQMRMSELMGGKYRGFVEGTEEAVDPDEVVWVPASFDESMPGVARRYIGQNDYLEVRFAGSDVVHNAQVTTESNDADVAIIKIDPHGASLAVVSPLPEDRIGEIQPGRPIVALGYQAGGMVTAEINLRASKGGAMGPGERPTLSTEPDVTSGILSNVRAKAPVVKLDKLPAYRFSGDLYQHTAPINPGSSGGPLFDQQGYVIGIVNAKILGMDATGFAVPIVHGLKLLQSTRSPAR
jgi:S1-C subfamily serine protease